MKGAHASLGQHHLVASVRGLVLLLLLLMMMMMMIMMVVAVVVTVLLVQLWPVLCGIHLRPFYVLVQEELDVVLEHGRAGKVSQAGAEEGPQSSGGSVHWVVSNLHDYLKHHLVAHRGTSLADVHSKADVNLRSRVKLALDALHAVGEDPHC